MDPIFYYGLVTVGWILGVIIGLSFIFGIFFTVEQQHKAIIERFGKFRRTADPGLRVKVPFIDRIAATVSLRVQPLDVLVETKTKDDVFVKVKVSVQHRVIAASAADSYYELQDPEAQITSYVLDVVRSKIPTLVLDEAFEKKDDVAHAVRDSLTAKMKVYGFEIPDALVTEIDPDAQVKHAMNEVQTQERLRKAAESKGEAAKILVVKEAEADRESKILRGQGIAGMRKAIIEGLRDGVKEFGEQTGVSAQEAMNLVLATQNFDMLRDVGVSAGAKVILVPHSPAGTGDIGTQVRNAVITGNEASEHHLAPKSVTPASSVKKVA